MLKNDVLVAKIGVDTAANEPPNVLSTKDRVELVGLTLFLVAQNAFVGYSAPMAEQNMEQFKIKKIALNLNTENGRAH